MRRRSILTALSSAILAGPALAGERLDALLSQNSVGMSPLDYGDARGPDAGPSFVAAQDEAVRNGTMLVVVPSRTFRFMTGVPIRSGVTWLMLGSVLKVAAEQIAVFEAIGVDDWSILGRATLVGTRSSPIDDGEQTGLLIRDCAGFYVEGVMARYVQGRGFYLGGASRVSRGDGRQFNNCAAVGCSVGREIEASAGGEFSTWTSWHASENALADRIAAGNTTTNGGVIAQNSRGIDLLAGPNHGHGKYVGVTIAHNNQFNVRAVNVWNGYTFSDCLVYENDVYLKGSRGIWFNGGNFDARVVNDGTSEARDNGVRGAFMPGSYQPEAKVFTSDEDDGTGRSKFVFRECSGKGAPAPEHWGFW